jgi:hypothetical protein
MGKPGFKHSHKRQGQPRAPTALAQLAREGRLRPEAVKQLIETGKLDQDSVSQLRTARTYPEQYLRPYWDEAQGALATTQGKAAGKAFRLLTFRVISTGSTLRPWQVVTGADLKGLSVYASYKHRDHAVVAATQLNQRRFRGPYSDRK